MAFYLPNGNGSLRIRGVSLPPASSSPRASRLLEGRALETSARPAPLPARSTPHKRSISVSLSEHSRDCRFLVNLSVPVSFLDVRQALMLGSLEDFLDRFCVWVPVRPWCGSLTSEEVFEAMQRREGEGSGAGADTRDSVSLRDGASVSKFRILESRRGRLGLPHSRYLR